MSEPIVQVKNLVVDFRTDAGSVRAVKGISFDIPEGQNRGPGG